MGKNESLDYLLNEIDKGSNMALAMFFQKIGLDIDILKEISNVEIIIDDTVKVEGVNAYGLYISTEDKITIDEDYFREINNLIKSNEDKSDAIKDVVETLIHEKIHALRRIHTPENIMDLGLDLPTMVRKKIVSEDGDEFNYVVPCDVLLEKSTNFKDSVSLRKRRDRQILLEEVITEALAKIIVYNYAFGDKITSFSDMIKKSISVENSHSFLGGMILANMKPDIVKWFLSTRASKEPYQDLIAESYGEDYEDLLSILECLHSTKNMNTAKFLMEKLCRILIKHRSRKR